MMSEPWLHQIDKFFRSNILMVNSHSLNSLRNKKEISFKCVSFLNHSHWISLYCRQLATREHCLTSAQLTLTRRGKCACQTAQGIKLMNPFRAPSPGLKFPALSERKGHSLSGGLWLVKLSPWALFRPISVHKIGQFMQSSQNKKMTKMFRQYEIRMI